jgi:predicted metal-dependent HD superfamily phosphohydrolase
MTSPYAGMTKMKHVDIFAPTEKDRSFLEQEWAELTADLPAETAREAGQNLFAAYGEKHRAYHNLAHIAALLRHCNEHRDALTDVAAVKFAIWFHDCVYKSSRKDNEEKSAKFAEMYLAALGVPEARRQAVTAMILATRKHDGTDATEDGKYFLDFDLSILGAPTNVYMAYANAIRYEYRLVPNFFYRPGRREVLVSFFNRPRLYFTDAFFASHEVRARENLRAEIQTLST